ncbi:DUF305 domain-containing protein [Pseudanabaena sp. lw0831]|uniref:DUF305 domain-containing protein n=1 Tax=Pseudanabaena sp. lw0831 TaxID=1357935 RepID=UPI001916BDE9|nr:DUF305 domain-containing protein [Pseudanabaena sp. lw0831]
MLFHIAKHRIASLILIVTAAASSGLTACTANNSASVPVTTPSAQPTKAVDKPLPVQNSSGMMSHDMSHSSMDLGVADADYDLRFIDGMTPHHQGAIAMAEDVLKNSQRPELKKLAQEIIQAQKKEIAQMGEWRKTWYPKADEKLMKWHAESNHMMAMTPEFRRNMMMSVDLGRADDKFDLRFLEAMIPHHEGALVMAKDAIAKSKRPEIQKLAQEILSSQQAEIDQMQQRRKSWYTQ